MPTHREHSEPPCRMYAEGRFFRAMTREGVWKIERRSGPRWINEFTLRTRTGVRLAILFFSIICISGCAAVTVREAVVADEMIICATTKDGEICVFAKDKLTRQIFWRRFEKTIEVIPRESRRNGMLGLHYPGNEPLVNDEDIIRVVFEEGQYHFPGNNEVLDFFDRVNNEKDNYVYTSDGLLLYYKIMPIPSSSKRYNVLNISLLQFMVNGQKPVNLTGSHDENITVYR